MQIFVEKLCVCVFVMWVHIYGWASLLQYTMPQHIFRIFILWLWVVLNMFYIWQWVYELKFILNIIITYIPGRHPPWPADHDGGHHCGLHPCQHPPHTRLQRPEVAQSAGELATLKTSVLNSTILMSRCCPGSCSMAAASWPASGPTSTTPHSAGGRRRSVEVLVCCIV